KDVITVRNDANVKDIAQILIEHHISAVPVVDERGALVGIVSEGDLIRRTETGTEKTWSSWLDFLVSNGSRADAYVKANARRASDIMTRSVITAKPKTPLSE